MRRRYVVEGMVQGVGFRHFTWSQARRLGLRGWVRNLPDGRVEVVVAGEADRLAEFEAVLRRGPNMASVTNVRECEKMDEGEELPGFEIR